MVEYLAVLSAASSQPVATAKQVGRAVVSGVMQFNDVMMRGDSQSQAALLGSVVGGMALGGFAKAAGLGVAFGGMTKGVEDTVNWAEHNAANATRLKTVLALQEAIFLMKVDD